MWTCFGEDLDDATVCVNVVTHVVKCDGGSIAWPEVVGIELLSECDQICVAD